MDPVSKYIHVGGEGCGVRLQHIYCGGYKDSVHKSKIVLHIFLLPRRWVRLQNLASSYSLDQNLFAFMLDQNHFVTEVTERELNALRGILCTQFQKLIEGMPSIGLISRGFIILKQYF